MYVNPKDQPELITGTGVEFLIEYVDGSVIAIGDTVSTINFLGSEGIRYAMESSEIAVKYIDRYLKGSVQNFGDYQQEMHRVFLKSWTISEKLGLKKYLADSDRVVDRVVNYLWRKVRSVLGKVSKKVRSYLSPLKTR